ncbi:MAG: hypothetical protein JSS27_09460 [Planctomycetes bacterium]|nr:hypothetical protein [Planctomycetota bacterium]
MKRLVWAALMLSLVGLNTGCCLLDRLCGVHPGYPLVPGCNRGCGSSCGPACGGNCQSCQQDDFYSSAPVPGNANSHACSCGAYAGPSTDDGFYADGSGGHGIRQAGHHQPAYARNPRVAQRYNGPMTPQVVYPYYTTRGPRDFLNPNPRGIGP